MKYYVGSGELDLNIFDAVRLNGAPGEPDLPEIIVAMITISHSQSVTWPKR